MPPLRQPLLTVQTCCTSITTWAKCTVCGRIYSRSLHKSWLCYGRSVTRQPFIPVNNSAFQAVGTHRKRNLVAKGSYRKSHTRTNVSVFNSNVNRKVGSVEQTRAELHNHNNCSASKKKRFQIPSMPNRKKRKKKIVVSFAAHLGTSGECAALARSEPNSWLKTWWATALQNYTVSSRNYTVSSRTIQLAVKSTGQLWREFIDNAGFCRTWVGLSLYQVAELR